jgi:hypothetical protein
MGKIWLILTIAELTKPTENSNLKFVNVLFENFDPIKARKEGENQTVFKKKRNLPEEKNEIFFIQFACICYAAMSQ